MTELIIDNKEIQKAMKDYVYNTYGVTMNFARWVDYDEPKGIVFEKESKAK